ncbi:odorant receptor coreceptor-like [Periplaneta americana]|uniref:odorant receptor coreceptor-like n=1 Tax=Periplaneta americana TaxID=6978 RepID=UPI0037E7CCB8
MERAPPRFKFFVRVIMFGGNQLEDRPFSFLYLLYQTFCVLPAYGYWMGEVIDLTLNWRDFKRVLETATALLPITACVWTNIYIKFKRRSFQEMILLADQFVWEHLPKRDPETGFPTKAGIIAVIEKVAVTASLCCLIPTWVYMAYRTFQSRQNLGLNAWLPFDTSYSPLHEFMLFFQIYFTIFNAANFYGYMTLYAICISIACTQLQQVGMQLDIYRQEKEEEEAENKGSPDVVERHDDDEENERLNNAIKLHQKTLDLMNAMESTLNLLILGHFMLIMIASCFACFSAVVTWGDMESLLLVALVFLSMPILLVMYCMLGEELTIETEELDDSIWFCNWVGANLKQQRSILFMKAVSSKEFCLTAGGFIPVSRNTMSVVVNQVMSYTMFLINVKEENENRA